MPPPSLLQAPIFQAQHLDSLLGGLSTAALGLGLKAAVPLQRPPHGFLVNMKLEAVDRRNPSLIRVASVEDVEDHRIKVALGPLGWGSEQADWAGIP